MPVCVLPGLCWLSHAGALRGEALGFLAARAEHEAALSGTAAEIAKSKRRWFRRGRGFRCAGVVPPARAELQRDEVRVPAQRLPVPQFPSEKRLFCVCWDALSDTGWFQPLPVLLHQETAERGTDRIQLSPLRQGRALATPRRRQPLQQRALRPY